MLRWISFVVRSYGNLLRLYPRRFRTEFEEEMRTVFADTAAEAAAHSAASFVLACLRELRDLPAAIIRERLRERRNMVAQTNYSMTDKPITWQAILAALLVFIIPGLYIVLGDVSPSVIPFKAVLYPALLAILLIIFIAGLIQAFPRWALPLVGLFFLPLLAFLIALPVGGPWWSTLLPSVKPGDEDARLLWEVINFGFISLHFLATAVLSTFIIPTWKPLRPLFWRIRRDWTQLSFLLYGAALFYVALAFEEYGHDEPFQIGSMLFLAAGAWAYLRSTSPRRRLLALLAGVTLSMMVIAVGKWLIVPMQNWPAWLTWHPPEVERRFELLRTLFELGWMLIVLAAPALLGLLPRRSQPMQSG